MYNKTPVGIVQKILPYFTYLASPNTVASFRT